MHQHSCSIHYMNTLILVCWNTHNFNIMAAIFYRVGYGSVMLAEEAHLVKTDKDNSNTLRRNISGSTSLVH